MKSHALLIYKNVLLYNISIFYLKKKKFAQKTCLIPKNTVFVSQCQKKVIVQAYTAL